MLCFLIVFGPHPMSSDVDRHVVRHRPASACDLPARLQCAYSDRVADLYFLRACPTDHLVVVRRPCGKRVFVGCPIDRDLEGPRVHLDTGIERRGWLLPRHLEDCRGNGRFWKD